MFLVKLDFVLGLFFVKVVHLLVVADCQLPGCHFRIPFPVAGVSWSLPRCHAGMSNVCPAGHAETPRTSHVRGSGATCFKTTRPDMWKRNEYHEAVVSTVGLEVSSHPGQWCDLWQDLLQKNFLPAKQAKQASYFLWRQKARSQKCSPGVAVLR